MTLGRSATSRRGDTCTCGGWGLPAGRMEEAAECMLVLAGATPEGKKELVGFQTGVREGAGAGASFSSTSSSVRSRLRPI